MIAAISARKSTDQDVADPRGPRMRMMLVSVLSALLFIAPAGFAEEPTGFADVPWGTLRKDVIEKFIKVKCNWSESQSRITDETIECSKYRLLEKWSPVNVKLSFNRDGRLTGYDLEAPWRSLEFRRAVISKFGRPKAVSDFVDPENSYSLQPGPQKPESEQLRFYRELIGQKWSASWQWTSGTTASLSEYHALSPFNGKEESRTTLGVWTKAYEQSRERQQREQQDRIKKGF